MGENRQPFPYKRLGNRLRISRESVNETLAEVSGAVEIDVEQLSKIEQGIAQPSEEVLLLLISYFDLNEDEAERLWELAGYENESSSNSASSDDLANKPIVVVLPNDSRTLYSDHIEVSVNPQGVVLNFQQQQNKQMTSISKIGVSKEQARNIIMSIQQALQLAEQPPRLLPKPKTTSE